MSGIFIKPSNTITFDLFVAPSKDGADMLASPDLERLKAMPKIDDTKIETHQITFRCPRYRDNVDLLSSSSRTAGEEIAFDAVNLQYQRMCRLLAKWTFKDGDQEVEVSQENIDSLHPNIAAAIIEKITMILSL